MANPLPPNPSMEQFRKQAKELRDLIRTGNPKFTMLAREFHPRLAGGPPPSGWSGLTLSDAQLIIARTHGFPSWNRLREQVERLARYSRSPQRRPTGESGPVDEFLRLACLTNRVPWRARPDDESDDPARHDRARELLAAHPELASATIHTAAAVGDVAAAQAMLAADPALANVDGGPNRWPPLLYAAFSRIDSKQHSTLGVARLLLEHGADPNAGYLPDGEPPPMTALSGAFPGRDPMMQPPHQYSHQLARLLLDAGADPNDERLLDQTRYPFDDRVVRLLLSYGLGRETGGPWRTWIGDVLRSPIGLVEEELRYAAMMNLEERVRLLLRHRAALGFDIDAMNTGSTAYDLARLAGNTAVVDVLAAAGARARPFGPVEEFLAAGMRGDEATIDRLLAADPGVRDRALLAHRAESTEWAIKFHPNPLYLAAFFDRPEAVRLLAGLGFPINDAQVGAVHVAAFAGHLDMVRLLVELGGDPTAPADDHTPGQFLPPDRTPIGWARYHRQHHVVAYLEGITG